MRGCLSMLAENAAEGMHTKELDALAATYIADHGAKAAFHGFHGFPGHICVSVNEECVHGIPGQRILQHGDIVSIDCGVTYRNLITDACVTVGIGEVDEDAKRLMQATTEALEAAVHALHPGAKVGDISASIASVAKEYGCTPVYGLTGHGLGSTLHQFPEIPNQGKAGTGPIFPENTLVAIEPIFSLGSSRVEQAEDGWTLCSSDGSWTSHAEHTLLLVEGGCEIIA